VHGQHPRKGEGPATGIAVTQSWDDQPCSCLPQLEMSRVFSWDEESCFVAGAWHCMHSYSVAPWCRCSCPCSLCSFCLKTSWRLPSAAGGGAVWRQTSGTPPQHPALSSFHKACKNFSSAGPEAARLSGFGGTRCKGSC